MLLKAFYRVRARGANTPILVPRGESSVFSRCVETKTLHGVVDNSLNRCLLLHYSWHLLVRFLVWQTRYGSFASTALLSRPRNYAAIFLHRERIETVAIDFCPGIAEFTHTDQTRQQRWVCGPEEANLSFDTGIAKGQLDE